MKEKGLSTLLTLLVGAVVGLAAPTQASAQSVHGARHVIINGTPLDAQTLYALERAYGTPVLAGRYWYDRLCGAWGYEGGPARGFIHPGLNLGGPLRADASGGRTGVFFNGRELHALDVIGLRQIIPVRPGRYWLDAWGNVGYEGGPAVVNLVQLLQSAGGGAGGDGSRGRGSILSTMDRTGMIVVGP